MVEPELHPGIAAPEEASLTTPLRHLLAVLGIELGSRPEEEEESIRGNPEPW